MFVRGEYSHRGYLLGFTWYSGIRGTIEADSVIRGGVGYAVSSEYLYDISNHEPLNTLYVFMICMCYLLGFCIHPCI